MVPCSCPSGLTLSVRFISLALSSSLGWQALSKTMKGHCWLGVTSTSWEPALPNAWWELDIPSPWGDYLWSMYCTLFRFSHGITHIHSHGSCFISCLPYLCLFIPLPVFQHLYPQVMAYTQKVSTIVLEEPYPFYSQSYSKHIFLKMFYPFQIV